MTDRFDFLIIGGGVAGASAGAALSSHGTVLLLEAETGLAYHASGRSAALYEQSYGQPSTVALNRASRAYFVTHGLLAPRGLMLVGTPDTAQAFERDRAAMGLDLLTGAEACDKLPILNTAVVDRAAYHDDTWDIDTDRLIQGYAQTIRRNGGTVQTNARITALQKQQNGWEAAVGETRFSAKIIVNAAGPWGDHIAAMAGVGPMRLQPMRRTMARIAAPDHLDISQWPMTFGADEAWYCKPDAGALIVSPADEMPMAPHDAYSDDIVVAEGIDRYQHHVTAPVKRLLSSWAGLRTFAPDRTLVIGRDTKEPTFIWCVGQGGYGVQSSPAAGQLLADIVTGAPPQIEPGDIAQLLPDRFG